MGKSVLELAVNSGQWDAGLKKAGSALNNFVQANGGLQQALDKDDKKISTFVQMMGKMESTATTAKGKMNDYKRSIEQLSEQFNRLTTAQKASVGSQYTATIDQLTRKYRAASAEVQKLNASIAGTSAIKGMSGLSAGIGSAFSAFGPTALAATGVAAAIGGMKSVMSDMVNINKQFEQSSANLASVMGGTRDQISALTQQAQQLGATTQYTAVQILDLQTNLAKLGFTQQEILSSTKPVQALATATGAELGEAATLAGAALRGFGLNAVEMERVASVLAVSTTKSALSFEKLATALPIVQVAASKTGFTIEDTVTMLGKLVDSGMNAASAATQLRKVLNDSTTDGTKLANALGGPVKGFDDLVEKLGKAREAGMTHAESVALVNQRNATALDILRDMAAQYTVTVDGVEKQTTALHEMRSAVTDCSVELQKMQDERLNTLEGSVTIMKSAWEGLMLTFSNSNGILKATTDALARLLQAYTNWRNRNAGGEGAIGTYTQDLTSEQKKAIDEEVKTAKASGKTSEQIKADTEQRIAELQKEEEVLNGIMSEYERYRNFNKNANWSSPGVAQYNDEWVKRLRDMGYGGDLESGQKLYKDIAAKRGEIAAQNYKLGLVTEVDVIEDDPNADAKAAEKLRTIEAQYKEQEMAQIAALDRQAMNEEEYEKKVYEIKRTWLQKIADLYEEGTEQRARANASISSLDIQYQGSVTRRANQQARAEERAAAKEKTAPFLYGDAGMANMASEIKKEMSTQIVGSEGYLINAERIVDLTTFQNLLKTATAAGIQLDPALVVGAIDRIGLGIDIPDEEWNALVEEINKHLKELKLPEIKLDVKTGSLKTASADVGKLSTEWVAAAQAVGQFGSALQSVEDPTAKIAGIIAQAIASVAAGAGSAIAEAGSGSAGGPWGWVAFAISATATMVSTIAAIKSATSSAGHFAQGGIVKGNSYSGDNVGPVFLDAGELILNRSQQANIAGQLQGQNPLGNLNITGILDGETIRLVLVNNALRRGGNRGEYAITKFG